MTLRTILRHPVASWRIWRDVYQATRNRQDPHR
jgi:hypothetical protein